MNTKRIPSRCQARADAMINKSSPPRTALDRITLPIRRGLMNCSPAFAGRADRPLLAHDLARAVATACCLIKGPADDPPVACRSWPAQRPVSRVIGPGGCHHARNGGGRSRLGHNRSQPNDSQRASPVYPPPNGTATRSPVAHGSAPQFAANARQALHGPRRQPHPAAGTRRPPPHAVAIPAQNATRYVRRQRVSRSLGLHA